MKHTLMCSCGKLAIKCKECGVAFEYAMYKAKKEVFDDIENNIYFRGMGLAHFFKEDFFKIKQKHLER